MELQAFEGSSMELIMSFIILMARPGHLGTCDIWMSNFFREGFTIRTKGSNEQSGFRVVLLSSMTESYTCIRPVLLRSWPRGSRPTYRDSRVYLEPLGACLRLLLLFRV